jgi:hypothetical protein
MSKRGVLVLLFLCIVLFSFRKDNWVVFLSHDETFQLKFPGVPVISKYTIPLGLQPLKSKMIRYEVGKFKDDNETYTLIYSDYPDSLISSDFKLKITDTFLKRIIFDIKDEIGGNLISIENVEDLKDYPGRHVHYTFANGKKVLNMKIYLVKSRLYMERIVCETIYDNNPAMEKFFDSFELLDAPKKKKTEKLEKKPAKVKTTNKIMHQIK